MLENTIRSPSIEAVYVQWAWAHFFFGKAMIDHDVILNNVETLVGPCMSGLGLDLIERELVMEYGRWVLRLYIDKPDGVTIEDCEAVSREVGPLLDVEDCVPMKYVLEVSSPGADRPLRRAMDFARFAGETAKIKTREPLDGRSNFRGMIEGVDGDRVIVKCDNQLIQIPLSAIQKARLVPNWRKGV